MELELARATIATAGAALTAAGRTDPGAPVPSCPGWSLSELVRHVGSVHAWVAGIVEGGLAERPPFTEAPSVTGAALADWADQQREHLLAVLGSADPDRPVWAFGGTEPARFWWRRQVHETSVHAWDGTAAIGEPWEIPGDVAADGLDEFLGWFLPRKWAREAPAWGPGRTVHFHRTDGDGEWMLTIGSPPRLDRGHGKGDLAVRGPASDLLRWSLHRPSSVELFGDTALADAWAANVSF